MILEELFTDVATLREYVPFMDSNISFSDLGSSAKSAKKQVCVIITPERFGADVSAVLTFVPFQIDIPEELPRMMVVRLVLVADGQVHAPFIQ